MRHTKNTITYNNHSGGNDIIAQGTPLSILNESSLIKDNPNISDDMISNVTVDTSSIQSTIDHLFSPRILSYRVKDIMVDFTGRLNNIYNSTINKLKKEANSTDIKTSANAINALENIDYGYIFKNVISPISIFKQYYEYMKEFINISEEDAVKKTLEEYVDYEELYSSKEKFEQDMKRIAMDMRNQYTSIVSEEGVFKEMCKRAIPLIELRTGYTINIDNNSFEKIEFNEDIDEKTQKFTEDDYHKENYMDMARQVSAFNKLSFKIKQILSGLIQVDSEGYAVLDDWENNIYINVDYAFGCLVNLFSDMVDSSDVMTRLKQFVIDPNNAWAEEIIELIEKDPSLITDFFVCFGNTFTNYYIQKEMKKDNGKKFTMFRQLNQPISVSYWADTIKNAFASGVMYHEDCIWNKKSEANIEKVVIDEKSDSPSVILKADKYEKEIKELEEFIPKFYRYFPKNKIEKTEKEKIELLYNYLENEEGREKVIKKITDLLHIIGVNFTETTVLAICTDNGVENISELISNIKYILKYASVLAINSEESAKTGIYKLRDPLVEFKKQYLNIVEMVNTVPEGAVEKVFKVGKNKYYSYHNPNYTSSLLTRLRDTNEERFNKFIDEEFLKSSWFWDSKNNRATNSFFEHILRREETSDGKVKFRPLGKNELHHKVLLLANDMPYEEWNSVSSMRILYNEYISIQSRDKYRPEYAEGYFPIPVISDTKSAEFIKLPLLRHLGNNFTMSGKNGWSLEEYEEGGLEFFEGVVLQEYNRIMLVRERYNKRMEDIRNKKTPDVKQIGNWDTTDGKNGGAEFKFIPALNDLRFEGDRTFIDVISDLKEAGDADKMHFVIRNILYGVINRDFFKAFDVWNKKGGFLEDDGNGYCKNILEDSFNDKLWSYNRSKNDVIEDIEKIKKFFESTTEIQNTDFYSNSGYSKEEIITLLNDLLEHYKSNSNEYDKEFDYIDNINFILRTLRDTGGLEEKLDNYSVPLSIKNNTMEEMREYYWNHAYSQAAILQLFITDLAFFNGMDDVQKRIKEIYSTVTKLDTDAIFNGKKVGKKIERTITLADETVISSVINEITSIVKARNKAGTLSDYDTAYILSKYGYSTDDKGNYDENSKYTHIGKYKFKTDKVNVADAQAYRSLDSYRAIMVMSKKWTDTAERAYNNISNGTWSLKDFIVLAQTLKPFMYATVNKVVGYEKTQRPVVDTKTGEQAVDANGNPVFETVEDKSKPIYMRVGIQHKNSEFTLFPIYGAIAGVLAKSPKMGAINQFMKDNDIDLVQFESAVKTGKQSPIGFGSIDKDWKDGNIDDDEYYDKIYGFLNSVCHTSNGINPDVVHEIPFERYGISTATPEHFIKGEDNSGKSLIGTQIRKLIVADMPEDAEFTIDGKKYNKKELLRLYDELNVENILNSFIDVKDIFDNPERLSNKLRSISEGNSKYGTNLSEGFTIDENGEFVIPLCDPIGDNKIEELCTSIFKNNISKQKIRGGALIQVSNYGYADDLKIVFKDENGEVLDWNVYKKKHKMAIKSDYEEFAKKALNEGKLSIAYFECYMPIPDMEMLMPLMNENGEIDIDKKDSNGEYIFSEELRKCVGYRIPTEAKYSMVPLRIKGFLPIQVGGAVMLPSEITTISGSGFDYNKIFVMLYEYYKIEHDIHKAIMDYYKNKKISGELTEWLARTFTDNSLNVRFVFKGLADWFIRVFLRNGNTKEFALAEKELIYFNEWYKLNKEKYKNDTPLFRKVNFDNSKDVKDNNLKQRNNMIIDIMFNILTSGYATEQILNPGGFDYLKLTSRITTILASASEKTINETISAYDKDLTNKNIPILEKLQQLDNSIIESIFKSLKPKLNPLSPISWVDIQQNNMMGKGLIGIYAIHDTSHAIMQNAKTKDDKGNEHQLELQQSRQFIINGKSLKSLHDIKNPDGKYITRNLAQFLNASVDNAKDPVLAYLNQNKFTADITATLLRLGYDIMEIGLLMTQPIVKRMTEIYNSNEIYTTDKQKIVKMALAELTKDNITFNENYNFTSNEFAENINLWGAYDRGEIRDANTKNKLIKGQINIALLMGQIAEISKDLSTVTHGTQFDTASNAAGPRNIDVIKIDNKAKRLIKASDSKTFSLSGAKLINDGIIDTESPDSDDIDDIDSIREKILDSPIPLVQAFYTLGIEGCIKLMGKHFPQLSADFQNVRNKLESLSSKGRLDDNTVLSIFKEMFVYVFSGTEFFGNEVITDADGNKKTVTARMKRDYFIRRFPREFINIRENNPDIAELPFMRALTVEPIKNTDMPEVLTLQTIGSLTKVTRDQYIHDWKTLLYLDNPEAHKLALNLVRYNYYRNGFTFGPKTFMNLVPTLLKKVIPDYIETLRKMTDTDSVSYTNFIDQYILHHLDDSTFVKSIIGYGEEYFSNISIVNDEAQVNINDTVSFKVHENDNRASGLVKEWVTIPRSNGLIAPILHQYISKSIYGIKRYYKLEDSGMADDGGYTASYKRVTPLGSRYGYYEYGKNAELIDSINGVFLKKITV
ncbi:MAG: hypothetical protein ACI358_01210 [Candidatus Limimorpha sp.]